jgi:hypothetical protein
MTTIVPGSSLRSIGSPDAAMPNCMDVASRVRHSSLARFRRTSERMRAKSATSLTGLVRKSSAPASRPRTRSAASLSAVTMTTGMCAVSASALIRRQTS